MSVASFTSTAAARKVLACRLAFFRLGPFWSGLYGENGEENGSYHLGFRVVVAGVGFRIQSSLFMPVNGKACYDLSRILWSWYTTY